MKEIHEILHTERPHPGKIQILKHRSDVADRRRVAVQDASIDAAGLCRSHADGESPLVFRLGLPILQQVDHLLCELRGLRSDCALTCVV